MRTGRGAPAVATPAVMAYTAGSFYLAGGSVAELAAVRAWAGDPLSGCVLAALGASALLSGAALRRWGRRLPRGCFHAVVVLATLLITAGVLVSPDPVTALLVAAMHVFVAFDVLYFFTWRLAVVHLTCLVACAVTSLLLVPGVGWAAAVGVAVVAVAIAVVVNPLVQRASSASRDSLTGLANRLGFDEALERVIDGAGPGAGPVSVVLLDVDRFKAVNDAHGHEAGDALLVSVARALGACCAAVAGAVASRRGGDEFALLLPMTGPRALDLVAGLCGGPGGPDGAGRAAFTLSGGVAELAGDPGAPDLLRRADVAMYAAKSAGRARAVLAQASTDALADDLRRALAADAAAPGAAAGGLAGGLWVALQPVVELSTGAVVGVEALARWDHPERGRVSPAEFVPAAEAHGLIDDLGALVLRRACDDAGLLRAAWGRDLLLTVNASGRELAGAGYAPRLLAALAETGWPPARLVVEVTESVLEGSGRAATATLDALRAAGVAVAIDDFGTGYSSFARLDTLPADYLKLDASFTSTLATSPARAAMLTAVVTLGAALGLEIIAEGVEDAEQEALLRSSGARLAQGYLLGRPAPVAELLASGTGPGAQPGRGRVRPEEPDRSDDHRSGAVRA